MPKKGYKQTAAHRKKFCRPCAETTKQKLSNALKGITQKSRSEETKTKMRKPKSALHIQHIKEARAKQVGFMHNKPHTKEAKLKMRLAILKEVSIKRNHGLPATPRIGKNESKILDYIELNDCVTLTRQHFIDGYFLDGYCKETNTAYEVDEKHHHTKAQRLKDIEREEYIKNKLNCNFIRLDEIKYMQRVKDL